MFDITNFAIKADSESGLQDGRLLKWKKKMLPNGNAYSGAGFSANSLD